MSEQQQAEPLCARDISEQLTLRDYRNICRYFDLRKRLKAKESVSLMSHGFETFETQAVIAKPWEIAKFDIFSIDFKDGELHVLACSDDTGMLDLTVERVSNVIEFPAKPISQHEPLSA